MRTIDFTPTWGEWGNLFYRFALCGEQDVLKKMHPDMAKAFALTEAFKAVLTSLSPEQILKAEAVIEVEMQKQGLCGISLHKT